MQDDDFPAAETVLSVVPAEVDEGAPFTATVTITTERNEQPHGDGGQMRVETADGSAKADLDYTALTPLTGTRGFPAADFGRVAVDGATRYQASKSVTITTINDTLREDAESFSVSIAKVNTGTAPAPGAIDLGLPSTTLAIDLGASSATLTIRANDASERRRTVRPELERRRAGAAIPERHAELHGRRRVRHGADHGHAEQARPTGRCWSNLTGDGSDLVDADPENGGAAGRPRGRRQRDPDQADGRGQRSRPGPTG